MLITNSKHQLLLVLGAFFFLFGCKGTKPIVGSTNASPTASVKKIMASHQAATPEYNTLAARVFVVYQDESKEQSITVSLRMEKDKQIWLKASLLGVTLSKVLITPTSVQYFETINKTYFDGDFTLLSKWLGTPLNFEQVQALLLGQSIFTIDPGKYTQRVMLNKYRIGPTIQPENFIHFIFLNPDTFKVASASLTQPQEKRELSLYYNEYQTIEDQLFPKGIKIESKDGNGTVLIDMTYKKIDINAPVKFPFKMPSGYEEIEL